MNAPWKLRIKFWYGGAIFKGYIETSNIEIYKKIATEALESDEG